MVVPGQLSIKVLYRVCNKCEINVRPPGNSFLLAFFAGTVTLFKFTINLHYCAHHEKLLKINSCLPLTSILDEIVGRQHVDVKFCVTLLVAWSLFTTRKVTDISNTFETPTVKDDLQ